MALHLTTIPVSEEAAPTKATPPGDVAGLRLDAWFLPADPQLGFVEIPAGPFTMGADRTTDPMALDNERWSADAAQGLVDLPAFYIGRYEVTAAAFEAFARETRHPVDARAAATPPDHPAAFVSWPDALAYCQWLDATLRAWPDIPDFLKARFDAGWRVTLPSEAQWEKAARGTDGRRYPWGDAPTRDHANISGRGTVPVGRLTCPTCAHGLAGMSGNVWEWTRSPYQPYPYDESDDRATAEGEALWVIRGGGFDDTEQNARTSSRGAADPGARRATIGFRVVLSP